MGLHRLEGVRREGRLKIEVRVEGVKRITYETFTL
jgi:hypothetical protein